MQQNNQQQQILPASSFVSPLMKITHQQAQSPTQSTPLVLAMNRLSKQSKSQMRKFTRLNEIPGQQLLPNEQQQQQQYFMELQHQQQRNVQQPIMVRGTPKNNIVIKKNKKKKKHHNQIFQQPNNNNTSESLLDQDEAQWMQQFGNKKNGYYHNNGAILTSDNESSSYNHQNFYRHNSQQQQQSFSSRKYNSIEPHYNNRQYQQPDTESESMGNRSFMSKRIPNNLLGSRNFNNASVAGYKSALGQYNTQNNEDSQFLPPLMNNNGSFMKNQPHQYSFKSQMDNYDTMPSSQMYPSDYKLSRKIHGNGAVDSSMNYHSQSSTKQSEKIGLKKQQTQLKPINNHTRQLQDIYEHDIDHEQSIPDMQRNHYDGGSSSHHQMINLGGGLALKRSGNNSNQQFQPANFRGIHRNNPNSESLITFRDQDQNNNNSRNRGSLTTLQKKTKIAQSQDNLKQQSAAPSNNIQFINMQIDEDVLARLQNNDLSDEEKHELIFNILKGHLESNGVKPNSHSPERADLQNTLNDSDHKKYNRKSLQNLKTVDTPIQQMGNRRKSQLRMLRDSLVNQDFETTVKKKKQSLSPQLKEAVVRNVVNNLTTSRHVNRYCRHCYLKALAEEERTKKNHLMIYDANNCQKFIDKIKKLNKKAQMTHKKDTQLILANNRHLNHDHISSNNSSHGQNSARMASLAKLKQRNSQHFIINNNNLNRSHESMQDLRHLSHNKTDSIARVNDQVRLKGSLSNGRLNEVMDSNYTLGGMKTATLNAGNYTIDVIRRSQNNQSIGGHESAKFLSGSDHQQSPEQRLKVPTLNLENQRRSNDSRKIVSISLAADLLDAFNQRKATYVVKKNPTLEDKKPDFDPNKRRITTYYERCKMRRQQLYGTKSQKNLKAPTPPLEFEGPFLNVEVRVQSAPRSMRSAGVSPLTVSNRDHSIQMQISVRDNAIQIEVEKVNNQMQTTQHKFVDMAIETEPPEEPVVVQIDVDQGQQTDQIALWLLKRAQEKKYMTWEEYYRDEQAEVAQTHRTQNKTVQANSKPVPVLAKNELLRISLLNNGAPQTQAPQTTANGKPLYHYVHNVKNSEIQCSIEEDEFNELLALEQARLALENARLLAEQARLARERELQRELDRLNMLQNAVPIVTAEQEAVFDYDKRKIETNEHYPSENNDWRSSGLYSQIYQKHIIDKERQANEAKSDHKKEPITHDEQMRQLMKDPGYRNAFGVIISGGGDAHDLVSIENSQDASSQFNTKKDVQDQMEDLNNLNPQGHDIYKELEVTYMAGLMKKKSSTLTSPESVKEIHEKAIMTLIVLTTNLISGDTPLENVLNFYQQPTVENVTRLLVRCKKMYDARVDVKKIILFIIQLQEMLSSLKVKRDKALEEQALFLIRRLQSSLSNFKNENKIFKAKFIFDAVDYYQYMQELEDGLTSGEFYVQQRLLKLEMDKKREEEEARKAKEINKIKEMQEEQEREAKRLAEIEVEKKKYAEIEKERKLAEEIQAQRASKYAEIALQTSARHSQNSKELKSASDKVIQQPQVRPQISRDQPIMPQTKLESSIVQQKIDYSTLRQGQMENRQILQPQVPDTPPHLLKVVQKQQQQNNFSFQHSRDATTLSAGAAGNPPLTAVRQALTVPALQSRDDDLQNAMKREESKTTLAMQLQSPEPRQLTNKYNNINKTIEKLQHVDHQTNKQQSYVTKQTQPASDHLSEKSSSVQLGNTVVQGIDRIAALRAYNVQNSMAQLQQMKPQQNPYDNLTVVQPPAIIHQTQTHYQGMPQEKRSDRKQLEYFQPLKQKQQEDDQLKIYQEQPAFKKKFYYEGGNATNQQLVNDNSSKRLTQMVSSIGDDRIFEDKSSVQDTNHVSGYHDDKIFEDRPPKMLIRKHEQSPHQITSQTPKMGALMHSKDNHNELGKSMYSTKTVQLAMQGQQQTHYYVEGAASPTLIHRNFLQPGSGTMSNSLGDASDAVRMSAAGQGNYSEHHLHVNWEQNHGDKNISIFEQKTKKDAQK